MSWFATKHAWKVTTVDKSTKMVLLALAFRIPNGYSSTEPTSLGALVELTGYDPRHLRRCLDDLTDVGEIVRLSRGKLASYHFQNMIGPLFSQRPLKTDSVSAFPQQSTQEKPDQVSENDAGNMSEKNRTSSPHAGGVSFLSEVPSAEVLTTTVEDAEVEAFLDWFIGEYRRRRGVLFRVSNPVKAEGAVRELLSRRTAARVRAMAIAMWEDTSEPWLTDPRNDRGVHSLLHKSTYLEGLVVAREQAPKATGYDATARCTHDPRHLNPWDCTFYNRTAKESVG